MLICVVPNTMMKLLCPIPETGQIHRGPALMAAEAVLVFPPALMAL